VNRVSLANAAPGSIAHAAQVKLTIAVFLMPILFPSSSYELCCYAFGFSDAASVDLKPARFVDWWRPSGKAIGTFRLSTRGA
jgi:hypothetical protein